MRGWYFAGEDDVLENDLKRAHKAGETVHFMMTQEGVYTTACIIGGDNSYGSLLGQPFTQLKQYVNCGSCREWMYA